MIYIGSNYRVKCRSEGGYLNEEGTFTDFNYDETWVEDGCQLVERISKWLTDEEFISIEYRDNGLVLEFYHPSGEGSTLYLTYEVIRDETNI